MTASVSHIEPRPRPGWRTELTSAQFAGIAEDLLGLTLAARAGGTAAVAHPFVDRGVDLYLRRLRTLLTIPIQVKAFRHVEPDGTATADFAADEVSEQVAGYWAVVHVPAPYDQLFPRLYLIPSIELRKRCPPVTSRMRGKSYRLTVNFAATGQDQWSDFALDIQTLESWINSIPDWSAPISPMSTMQEGSESSQIGTVGIAALSDSWALAELERAGRGRFVFAQDRTRLDTVTILAHDLSYSRFAGLHVRTGYFNTSRRTHFEVKRRHFFTSPSLYVLLLLLTPGQQVHDFCLLIPSSDIPTLGYSETITLNPLIKGFQQYRTPSEDFGAMFLQKAFNGAAGLYLNSPSSCERPVRIPHDARE